MHFYDKNIKFLSSIYYTLFNKRQRLWEDNDSLTSVQILSHWILIINNKCFFLFDENLVWILNHSIHWDVQQADNCWYLWLFWRNQKIF